MKQTAKYLVAVVIGFGLSTATFRWMLNSDFGEEPISLPLNQLVFLKSQKASVAANVVRSALRNDGLEVAIGSDDSINAVLIQADKETINLAIAKIRDLDLMTPAELN